MQLSKYEKKIFTIIAILAVSAIFLTSVMVSKINEGWEKAVAEQERRQVEKDKIMEQVKRDCDVVHKELGSVSAETTYKCKDGVRYTFTEWL